MLKAYIILIVVVAWACGEAASAYLKGWEDGEMPERPTPYEQAMLKRLQSYLDSEDRSQRFVDADQPAKRQMRYNQCYFNPISCFKRRK